MTFRQLQRLTSVLREWQQGFPLSRHDLFNALYAELRKIARGHLKEEKTASLQTDLLVNEAFLRLQQQNKIPWKNRFHFYAIASLSIKQFLIERARARKTFKRGQGIDVLPLHNVQDLPPKIDPRTHALRDALEEFKMLEPRKAAIVELRFYGGLSNAQIAMVFQKSISTIKRDWEEAKLWLKDKLNPKSP